MTEWRDLPPPPDPDQPGWDRSDTDPEPPRRSDVGIIAIVLGCIGIVTAGIVLAIVTAVLASVAGAQAREQGRSPETAYFAFGLAVLDGTVWLVLHYLFKLPIYAG
jgi:hypothetical protein